ncbi:MAG: MCE family protein [Verrucomicrobia bacterium]|nr:MCE family protein [Verrucomicrobiota bacterium]
MKDTLETRLGIFFALALIAGAVILEMIGSFDTLKHGLILRAHFNNVLELKTGDPVKMAGKPIGYVEDIRFDNRKVLVVMKVTDSTAVVRTDSKAVIKFSGLLGQNYVSISFGTEKGAPVATGAELETEEQTDLNQLMTKLENVAEGAQRFTDSLGDINFEELLQPMTDFLKQAGPNFATVLTNAADIAAQIRSGKGAVGRLIYEENLYDSATNALSGVNRAADQAQAALADARRILNDLRAGKGTIGRLMSDELLYNETTQAMSELREIFQKVNRGEGTAGRIVNDPSLVNEATLTLRKVDKATEGMEDQGPLSILGILVNPLF